jgi:peptidylprolyl isomerase
MSRFKLLLASCLLFGLVSAPADAKKQFTKSEDAKKAPLGAKTVTLPSGLAYTDDIVGTGTVAQLGNVIWIDYTGWVMPDKKEFDSTKLKGRPLNIVLGGAQMCKGVDDGVLGMKVNGKRTILVPPELGFPKGSSTSRIIPPDSRLKYEITLVHVGPKLPKKPVAPPTDPKAPAKTPAKAPASSAKPS